jgi:two-component system NarL family sensor kinase
MRSLKIIFASSQLCWKVILSLPLIFVSIFSYGQKEFIDSLKNRIDNETNLDEKVRMNLQLGTRLANSSDSIESRKCHAEIVRIANETGNEFYLGQAYMLAGTLNLAKPARAIVDYERALKIFEKFPDREHIWSSIAPTLLNLGVAHNNGVDYQAAIDYYLKAEEVYLKNQPEHPELGVLYSNISITYGTINRYDDALKYSKKGYDRARKRKDPVTLMTAYYAHGGNLVNAKRNGELGIVLLDSAKQIAVKLNNLYYIYSSDLMTAMYYYNTKQYRKAIEFYSKNMTLARQFKSRPDIGNCFLNISACLAELKLPREAAASLDSSAKYLDLKTMSVSKQMYYENYAETLKQLGNFTKAFAFKDSVGVIKDSLYQADNLRQLQFRQARYNYEKRQTEIEQLEADQKLKELAIEQKNTLNYILIGTAVTLIVISILGYRNYRQKQVLQQQRISELEKEKQLTATEAVLKGEEQERTRLAKDLHDGLGGMLSGIKYSFNTMKGNFVMTAENNQAFERSMDMLDSSIKELRRVAHNMMPEALVKFGLDTALRDYCNDVKQNSDLEVNYHSVDLADANPDQTTSITIYRIVQELVNNTMKHGAAKKVIVQITKTDNHFAVTVEDDGKGFNTAILKQSKGIGWTNIQHRVEFLKGKLDVNSEPGKGTSVYIEFNV